jgi:hypothetical protein
VRGAATTERGEGVEPPGWATSGCWLGSGADASPRFWDFQLATSRPHFHEATTTVEQRPALSPRNKANMNVTHYKRHTLYCTACHDVPHHPHSLTNCSSHCARFLFNYQTGACFGISDISFMLRIRTHNNALQAVRALLCGRTLPRESCTRSLPVRLE